MATSRDELQSVLAARHEARGVLARQLAEQQQSTRDAIAIANAKATTNPQRAPRN